MDESGAVTERARELNEGRVTYDGGAAKAAREDERRRLLEYLPSDKFLDQEHYTDVANDMYPNQRDRMRREIFVKAGVGVSRGSILRPDQYDALLAQVRAAKT